ncbi:uncharacterized protein IL334_002288 [Kwoniella shivajii]|uniref:Uncharacterized protein n=1 Tax=Kwoniella shivajii TaxID=564305 RepID=A0ABZ1CVX4_9TREE|nr:hypothetical protein IL334_002288 [Kwoniella shivajii]
MPHKRAKRSVRVAETAKKGSNLDPKPNSGNPAYDDTPKSASRIISGWKFQSSFRETGRTNSEDKGGNKPSQSSSTSNKPSETKKGSASRSKLTNGSDPTSTSISTPIPTANNQVGGDNKKKLPSILPHESLGEYNRRIEDLLRPGVSKAIKEAASVKALEESNARKEKKDRKKRVRIEKLVKDGKLPKEALEKLILELKEKKDGKRKRNDNDDGDDQGDNPEDGDGDNIQKQRPAKEFKQVERPRRLNDIVQAPPQLQHLRRSNTEKKSTSAKDACSAVGKGSGKVPLNAGQKRILEEEREKVIQMYRDIKAKKEEERLKEVKKV